jgi:peroxiredoxin
MHSAVRHWKFSLLAVVFAVIVPKIAPAADDPTAPAPTIPKVILSDAHAKLCRVKVGDTFPDLRLPAAAGHEQQLARLRGEKLSVIAFWTSTKPTTVEELADLAIDVDKRFAKQGVGVVAINLGDDPKAVAALIKQSGARFPILFDHDGAALKQLGEGKTARTYLIDAGGKILWFDLEYSCTTRRDLQQAIRAALTTPQAERQAP